MTERLVKTSEYFIISEMTEGVLLLLILLSSVI